MFSLIPSAASARCLFISILFALQKIIHQYPHCWRCKKPVLFRATEQWFCSVDAIKDQAIEAIKGVKWIPGWGEDRISSMVRDRNDWCISRQRRWGVPIPIFYCKDCGEPLIEKDAMHAVSEQRAPMLGTSRKRKKFCPQAQSARSAAAPPLQKSATSWTFGLIPA